jgi:hypothetical protein
MPEVWLTQYDRTMVASYMPVDGRAPRGVRPGTWARLLEGESVCIDLDEWMLVWATFPIALRVTLLNAPRPTRGESSYGTRWLDSEW